VDLRNTLRQPLKELAYSRRRQIPYDKNAHAKAGWAVFLGNGSDAHGVDFAIMYQDVAI
jgi:hypothetical protein